MILRDPHALHRDFWTGQPDGAHDEWTSWDFALAMATQFVIDGTTEEGHLAWEIDDDRVAVDAIHDVNKARQAIDTVTQREGYKPVPGEFYRTKLLTPWHDDSEGEFVWQTREEWIKKKIEEDQG